MMDTCTCGSVVLDHGREEVRFGEETLREGDEFLEQPLQRGDGLTDRAALDQAVCDCFEEVEVAGVRGCDGVAEEDEAGC